jgi:hypothetical protein
LKPLSGEILEFDYGIGRMKGTMMSLILGNTSGMWIHATAISINEALIINQDKLRLRKYSHLILEKTFRRGETDRERANVSLDLALAKSSFSLPHSICTNFQPPPPIPINSAPSFWPPSARYSSLVTPHHTSPLFAPTSCRHR